MRNEMQKFFRLISEFSPSLPRPVLTPPPSVVPTDRGRNGEGEGVMRFPFALGLYVL